MQDLKTDAFASVLRKKDQFSQSYIRAKSPPNLLRVSLERETAGANKLSFTTTTTNRMRLPPAAALRGVQTQPIISTNPPTVCVNCSKPASLCMVCTEIVTKNALMFQRKGTALGAIEFFKKAVHEAGQKRLVKLIVFKLWKNGFSVRKEYERKLSHAVRRMHLKANAEEPFLAWKKFTHDAVQHRKDKKIEELTKKVQLLEEIIRKMHITGHPNK